MKRPAPSPDEARKKVREEKISKLVGVAKNLTAESKFNMICGLEACSKDGLLKNYILRDIPAFFSQCTRFGYDDFRNSDILAKVMQLAKLSDLTRTFRRVKADTESGKTYLKLAAEYFDFSKESVEDIKTYFWAINWDYEAISSNPTMSINVLLEFPKRPWNWNKLRKVIPEEDQKKIINFSLSKGSRTT